MAVDKDDEQAIRKFLARIDCLDEIEQKIGRVNVFDILGMARNEIRHSRMLRWLLDAKEFHGLGSLFLRTFFQKLCDSGADAIKLLTSNLDSYVVIPEYKHIDLLLISHESNIVVAIENKVDSGEHDNQLQRYKEVIIRDFPGYHREYVFLSPGRDDASDPDWHALDYASVLDAVSYCRRRADGAAEAMMMLAQYERLLEREFMNKQEMAEICNKIYREHKRAIDLITEYREDRLSVLADMIGAWLKSHPESGLIFDESHSCKTYIRFSTVKLEKLVPLLPNGLKSGWNSSHSSYYEFINREGVLGLKHSLSLVNLPDSVRMRIKCTLAVKDLPADRTWKTIHTFSALWRRKSDDNDVSLDEEQVAKLMQRAAKEIVEYEKAFDVQ